MSEAPTYSPDAYQQLSSLLDAHPGYLVKIQPALLAQLRQLSETAPDHLASTKFAVSAVLYSLSNLDFSKYGGVDTRIDSQVILNVTCAQLTALVQETDVLQIVC